MANTIPRAKQAFLVVKERLCISVGVDELDGLSVTGTIK